MTRTASVTPSNLRILPWVGVTLLSLAVACTTQSGTDDPDDGPTGGDSSGGASTGGQSTGGQSTGGQSTGGGLDEDARREECLRNDPNAVFEKSESGCWVCKLTQEREPELLDFAEPWCFEYGFQLRKVDLGCGYLRTSWTGDAGDSGGRVYAVIDSSSGQGGEGGGGGASGTRFNAVLVASVFGNNGVCGQELYGIDELPRCDSMERICPAQP